VGEVVHPFANSQTYRLVEAMELEQGASRTSITRCRAFVQHRRSRCTNTRLLSLAEHVTDRSAAPDLNKVVSEVVSSLRKSRLMAETRLTGAAIELLYSAATIKQARTSGAQTEDVIMAAKARFR